ncbi:MAG: aldehyde ferredoxin oxidoreductase family protein [Thermoplasmata archaeon]|nr:aldehyde ferredoxin oxidoreductase family protein [Thermoplasmata archaeon]
MHGYSGMILEVDLTEGEISTSKVTEKMIRNYLGGNGFATKILYDNFKSQTDAFDPENILVITPGVFTGTPVPTGGKVVFHTKSPLTGTFTDSVMGGAIGAELKYAGYDAIVITGKSAKPVYITIFDDKVELKNAEHLWGKDTRETDYILKRELGNNFAAVASIGIGGENMVRYACVCCDERQSGRGGVGAVMGAKNLKAIAVHGTNSISVANPFKFQELIKGYLAKIVDHPDYNKYTKYGTGEFMDWMNVEKGVFPTRNWQQSVFDKREHIDPYYWGPKYVKKNKACFACVRPCGRVFKIENGKYEGTVFDGVEYETLYSLGSQCGNPDIEALGKANELCDLYGIDTISAGVCIGFAMELYEKGILTKEDVGDLELRFGNGEAVPQMVELIAKREGLGNILAEGVKRAAEHIGQGAEDYAIHVKGQEPPAYDMRGLKGMGLAFMSSWRGACHLKSSAYALELTGKYWKFKGVDRLSAENKGEEIKAMEDFVTIYDCLGICKFSRKIYYLEQMQELLEVVTGFKFTEDELMTIGERLTNLKRLFNLREGITRKDDKLPKRILSEPIPEGVSKGHYIKPEEAEMMIGDYYRVRGWDEEGVPTEAKLEELGITK